jgi:hypothetical protein
LVIIWALAGIATNQSSYPNIVLTAEVAITTIVVALAAEAIVSWLRRRHLKKKTLD